MADTASESARLIGGSYSPHAPVEHHAGAVQPLANARYASKRTTRTDHGWTIAYLTMLTFCFVGGIALFVQAGKAVDAMPTMGGFYNHSLTCNPSTWDASWHKLHPGGDAPPPPARISNATDSDSFDKALGKGSAVWLPVTLVLGVPASLLFVHLFKRYPLPMVKISVYGNLALLGLMAVLTLPTLVPLGVSLLILFIVMAIVCYFLRKELELTAELVAVASRALSDNFRLLPTVLAIKLVTCVALLYFMITSGFAFAAGKPVPNSDVVTQEAVSPEVSPDVGVCYDVRGLAVPCCDYSLGAWPVSYLIITYLFIAWTVLTAVQVKLHIVADLVAQWYYAPPGYTSPDSPGAPSLKLAVHHALTTGFGTAAFGGAILFLVRTLRNSLRNGARRNLCCALLNCMLQPVLAALEMFTNFAAIAAAITGKPLVPAARDMLAAFKRCFLQTTTVWWVPEMVMGFTVFSLSLVWSILPFLMTAAVTDNWGAAFIVGFFCFLLLIVILNFSAGVLLDVVNTVYVLFALDRDQHMVTRTEVHQVFSKVAAKTSPDAVVEQPDGHINYGRAEEGRMAPAAPAPATPGAPEAALGGAVYGTYVAPGVYAPSAPSGQPTVYGVPAKH